MMRTSSVCYSNLVPKFCLKSPYIRLTSSGRIWARNFNVLSSSSSTTESSANCCRSIKLCDAPAKTFWVDRIDMLVLDLETGGLDPRTRGILEIAIQAVLGGKNSCFHTLVNPEQDVPNSYIHGITTDMVRRTYLPTIEEVIPFLLQFIQSRQVPGRQVLLVAHNARRFDVRFLIEAFRRCSCEIPHDWLFLDTLPLAREVRKLYGPNKGPEKLTLKALGDFYRIPLDGKPHRAMTDVKLLTSVLVNMISDLKLDPADLLQRSFRASDVKV